MTRNTPRSRQRIALGARLAIVAGAVLAGAAGSMSPAGADRPGGDVADHQIEICHGTASAQNPYTTPTPFKWQIMAPNGHDTHNGDHNTLPDIVPPFAAGSQGNHSWDDYLGKNWTTEVADFGLTGRQIWEQGCNTEAPPVGSITLDKVTAGDGQPVDTTAFGFTVDCDGEATVTAGPSVAPVDPALEVVSGASPGETCTITETGSAGAASTTYSINGGAEQSGAAVVTFESSEQAFAVVFTNTYACPAGQVPNGEGGCGVDACPTVDGFQADTTLCPVVENTVVTAAPTPPPPPPAPTQVAGVQVTQELPRTGKSTLPLAEMGLGLVLLGAGALLFARDEAATA